MEEQTLFRRLDMGTYFLKWHEENIIQALVVVLGV